METLETLASCPICSNYGHGTQPVKFFINWISSEWAPMMEKVIDLATRCGHTIELVDITKYTYPRSSLGVEDLVKALEAPIQFKVSTLKPRKMSLTPKISSRTPPQWLVDSYRSELRTKYKGELPHSLKWLEALEASVIKKLSLDLYQSCLNQGVSSDEVWIYSNGRYATQRTILESAISLGVRTLCFERSRFPERLFLRPYRVHDRMKSQRDFLASASAVSSQSKNAVEKWIDARSNPNSRVNPFAENFSIAKDDPDAIPENSVIFFSSSRDELEGLGEQWGNFGWKSQYEAFSALGHKFRKAGFATILRLHPNLANKSMADLRDELDRVSALQSEGFLVFGPRNPINSYQLVMGAKAVVVSRSTIGIEALALGLPVIATANSFYDQLNSLITAKDKDSLEETYVKLENFDQKSSSQEAVNWLAFNYERDIPFKRVVKIAPTVLQSLSNILHFDVALYYVTATIVDFFTRSGKKRLLEEFSKF